MATESKTPIKTESKTPIKTEYYNLIVISNPKINEAFIIIYCSDTNYLGQIIHGFRNIMMNGMKKKYLKLN